MLKVKTLIALLLVSLLGTFVSAGPQMDFGDDGYLKLGFLGQVHYSFLDGAPDEDDFFLRRGRIIGIGQITDGIKVFFETDNDRHGNYGSSGVSTDIQDAFVDIRFGDTSHWLEMGLILLPFSFETTASAVSLLGIDYNAETIKLTNTFVWRDYGAMVHGSFGDKVEYRIGVFDGYEVASKNADAALRFTGHIAVNLLGEVEKGWFATNDTLGKANYISIGAGYDNQDEATSITTITNNVSQTTITDSEAWVFDIRSGFVFSDMVSMTLNAAYYDWDNSGFVGNTYFAEAGLKISQAQLTLKYSVQDNDNGTEIADTTAGLHYYMKGHAMRGGVEYRTGDSADWTLVGISFLL